MANGGKALATLPEVVLSPIKLRSTGSQLTFADCNMVFLE